MFRDKPSAYERMTDAISDIADSIADLENQIAERVRPSRTERLRRSIANEWSRLPGVSRASSHWHLPAALGGYALPNAADAQASLEQAQGSIRRGANDLWSRVPSFGTVRRSAADLRDHAPSWRWPGLPSQTTSFRRGMQTQRGIDRLGDRPELTGLLIAGGAILAVGAAFYVTKRIAEHSEEPDYETVRNDGDIEVRDYDAMVVAETVKSGYHEKARRRGFETLYDYLRANNRSGKKIAMTTPVLQQLSEGDGRTKGWAVRFAMPKKYTKSSLPAPNSNEIQIREIPARRLVAIRFSGAFNASLASRKLMGLYNYLSDEGLKQKGDPIYAFYSPPWTPGFMRRNEILLEVER